MRAARFQAAASRAAWRLAALKPCVPALLAWLLAWLPPPVARSDASEAMDVVDEVP